MSRKPKAGQFSLFDPPSETDWWADAAPDYDPDSLRYYQREAFDAVYAAWEEHRSVMIAMATGMGKTRTFGAIAKHFPGRVLVLAHREELITQAVADIEKITGERVQVEQAQLHCDSRCRVVVGSVDTVKQPHRLKRMGEDRFDLVIVDEAHHYVGNTYTRPLEFFASAKILGVTATADRGDKRALGKTFEHVAYEMNISSGIDAGYLTPIRGRRVFIEAIDLTKVKKQGGDMHQGELDEVMLEAVEGVVRKTLELEPGRQAIAFFPGVRSSELAAERFNALKPNSAIMVSGETDKDERRLLLRDFKEGKYQYLCNCMIATEGFDAPGVSLIIMGRPTGSRALYTQMAGRGTRVLPEAGVDSVQGSEGSAERRALIAASAKPDMVILDFCGNSGKHDLCSPEDILGGDYTEKEVALAKQKAEAEGGGEPEGHLKEAREDIRRLAQTVAAAKVHASEEEFSPFSVLNVDGGDTYNIKDGFKPATDNQKYALERMGLTKQELREVSFMQAKKLLDARSVRMKNDLATYKQMLHLKKYGVEKTNVTFANAKRAMDYIAKMGWGKSVSHRVVNSLAFPKEL